MMATTSERRRNMRPDTCHVCGLSVPAFEGWLYSVTGESGRGRRRRTGYWPKVVRCDRCHRGRYSHPRMLPLPDASTPIRSVSVTEVRRATVERSVRHCDRWGGYDYPVLVLVLPGGDSAVICMPDSITGKASASPAYYLLENRPNQFNGRPVTSAAEKAVQQIAENSREEHREYLESRP